MNELTITHNAGFFSCCSVRLHEIIKFFNEYKRVPQLIGISSQFAAFKDYPDEDINPLLFKSVRPDNISYREKINYKHCYQYTPYTNLDFKSLTPFIRKYFSISDEVRHIIKQKQEIYDIDYSNTAAVFYRGNDKITETQIASYYEFYKKCQEIYSINKNIKFLVQTDELDFLEGFRNNFTNNIYFDDIKFIRTNKDIAVHHTLVPGEKRKFAQQFLAATNIVAKCNTIITHSGNCGIWATLYRGNAVNVHQYLMHPDQGWV